MDNDYAPEIQRRRRAYVAAKKVLKENNIRFHLPFPASLRVYYRDGTVTYNTAYEATTDMVKRGLWVDIVKDRANKTADLANKHEAETRKHDPKAGLQGASPGTQVTVGN